MKVLDIIAESSKPDPESLRFLTGEQITQFLDQWNKSNPHGQKINATIDSASENKFQKWLRNRSNLIAAEEAKIAKTMSWLGPIVHIAGLLTVIAEWRMRMYHINEEAGEKNPDGTYVYSAQDIMAKRNQVTGMFVTVYLIEWAVRSMQGGKLAQAVAMMLRGAAKGLMGRGGVWAAAITYFASELAIQGIKAWLMTDNGRAWFCQNFIVNAVVGKIGGWTEDIIGWIVTAIKDTTGLDLDTTPNITQREKELPKFDIPKIDPKAAAAADMKDKINRYLPDPEGNTWADKPGIAPPK